MFGGVESVDPETTPKKKQRISGATYICGPPSDCADPHPHRWYCMRGHPGAEPGVCLLKCCGGPGLADWQIRGFADEAAMKEADAS